MSPVILIIPQTQGSKGTPLRTGGHYDTAFIDTVRTLNGRAQDVTLLVPWSPDLAPLVATATLDLAPSFDPEGRSSEPKAFGTIVVPYLLPGEAEAEVEDNPFWQASYLSLTVGARRTFADTVRDFPITHVVALGKPSHPASFRHAVRGRNVEVLVFQSLLGPEVAARVLGVPRDQVIDLEAKLTPLSAEDAFISTREGAAERTHEKDLEPYVPFSVLLQVAFDKWLAEDEPDIERGAERS